MFSVMPGIVSANILIVQWSKDKWRSITRDISCRFTHTYPHTLVIASLKGKQWPLTLQCRAWDAPWSHPPRMLVAGYHCDKPWDIQGLQYCNMSWAWSCPDQNDGGSGAISGSSPCYHPLGHRALRSQHLHAGGLLCLVTGCWAETVSGTSWPRW